MATTDFKTIGGGGGANVTALATYQAYSALLANGYANGAMPTAMDFNRMMRQLSIPGAVLTQYIADTRGVNSVEDGTTATLLANLKLAVKTARLGHTYTDTDWVPLFDGVIFQWGYVTTNSSGQAAVTFPTAFPTNFFRALINPLGGASAYAVGQMNSQSVTGFNQNIVDSNTHALVGSGIVVGYMAVGN